MQFNEDLFFLKLSFHALYLLQSVNHKAVGAQDGMHEAFGSQLNELRRSTVRRLRDTVVERGRNHSLVAAKRGECSLIYGKVLAQRRNPTT